MTAILDRGLPSNPEAEKFILASVMLGAARFEDVAAVLKPEDFCLEPHRRIFAAMGHLYTAGNGIDRVTLANYLNGAGQLESVGGVSYVACLDEGMPALSNLDTYITIVREKSVLRRLVLVAQGLIDRCLMMADQPSEIITEAERTLVQLGADLEIHGDWLNPGQVIERAPGGLQQLISPIAGGVGIPTPWKSLNTRLCGLHPGELFILAGRPSMGKSVAGMQMAYHASLTGHPAGFISLEMSKESLIQRIIAAVGRLDSQAMRAGELSREGRELAMRAVAHIRDLPLFIDDTRARTPSAVVAALRRLKARADVKLLVVDHLQLMRGVGRQEKRNYELASIVGDMKHLAADAGVCVMLLSQLNRECEIENRRPQQSDLRDCVTGDTRVIDAATGAPIPIREVRAGMSVFGLGLRQKLLPFTVSNVWPTGRQWTLCVRTTTGRRLCATQGHRVFTATGWKKISDLFIGERIAVSLRLPAHGPEREDRSDLCRLLGLMAGDGSYLKHRGISFISNDSEVFEDLQSIVFRNWPSVTVRMKPHPEGYLEADFSQVFENGYGKPHGNQFREWLKEVGVFGKKHCEKTVPKFVFESGVVGAASYLAGLLATDGCVKRNSKSQRWQCHFDTTSRMLADDAQALLLRLGIVSTIRLSQPSKTRPRAIYRVDVSGVKENLSKLGAIPAPGKKGRLLEKLVEWCERSVEETGPGPFGLPPEVSRHLAIIDPEQSWRDQGKCMRRSTALEHGHGIGDRTLVDFAESDLLWDQIVDIAPNGFQDTFDITVPASHSFLANGILAHNCGDIEQDADVVMFCHRPERYMKNHDRADLRGVAEFIVAKQRMGPVGTVRMVFLAAQQKFEEAYGPSDND